MSVSTTPTLDEPGNENLLNIKSEQINSIKSFTGRVESMARGSSALKIRIEDVQFAHRMLDKCIPFLSGANQLHLESLLDNSTETIEDIIQHAGSKFSEDSCKDLFQRLGYLLKLTLQEAEMFIRSFRAAKIFAAGKRQFSK